MLVTHRLIFYFKDSAKAFVQFFTAIRRLFGWLVGFLTSSCQPLGYIADGFQDWRLTILRAATHEAELVDHNFCLNRSHYTDTDPTSRRWLSASQLTQINVFTPRDAASDANPL